MSRNSVKHSFIVTFTFISNQVPVPLNNSKLSCVIELKMFSDLCHLNSSYQSVLWIEGSLAFKVWVWSASHLPLWAHSLWVAGNVRRWDCEEQENPWKAKSVITVCCSLLTRAHFCFRDVSWRPAEASVVLNVSSLSHGKSFPHPSSFSSTCAPAGVWSSDLPRRFETSCRCLAGWSLCLFSCLAP